MFYFEGIGLENLISVATDVYGKMSVSSLIECVEKALADGQIPLMVCATSGTNPLGAFDPLEAISEVCKKYDMWLHSDGALGKSSNKMEGFYIPSHYLTCDY